MFVLFWGCVCDAVHQPINLLKASLVYGKRLTICVQCTLFIGVGLRLSQAADSAEVSYAVALLYLHFAFLQRFDSNCWLVCSEALKCIFLRISLGRELKHDGTISRDKYDHFN